MLSQRFSLEEQYGSIGTGFAGVRIGADCNFGQSVLF